MLACTAVRTQNTLVVQMTTFGLSIQRQPNLWTPWREGLSRGNARCPTNVLEAIIGIFRLFAFLKSDRDKILEVKNGDLLIVTLRPIGAGD
jgi:hypothetical protein